MHSGADPHPGLSSQVLPHSVTALKSDLPTGAVTQPGCFCDFTDLPPKLLKPIFSLPKLRLTWPLAQRLNHLLSWWQFCSCSNTAQFQHNVDTTSQRGAVIITFLTSAAAPHSLPYCRASLWGVSQFYVSQAGYRARKVGEIARQGSALGLQTQVAVSLSVSPAQMICLSTSRTCGIILNITTWAPRKPELQELACQWTWEQTRTCETWHMHTCVTASNQHWCQVSKIYSDAKHISIIVCNLKENCRWH